MLSKDRFKYALILCLCSFIPLVITATFMGVYWNLYTIADEYDFTYEPGASFDGCGMAEFNFVTRVREELDTKWSVAITFNAIVYTLLTAFTLCLVASAYFWPLVCIGSFGFCVT